MSAFDFDKMVVKAFPSLSVLAQAIIERGLRSKCRLVRLTEDSHICSSAVGEKRQEHAGGPPCCCKSVFKRTFTSWSTRAAVL